MPHAQLSLPLPSPLATAPINDARRNLETSATSDEELRLLRTLLHARDPAQRRPATQALAARLEPLLVGCIRRSLRRFRIRPRRDDIDDHLHDIWVTLLRDDARVLRRFDPRRSRDLRAYLARIALRTTIDTLRTRGLTDWEPIDGDVEELLHARAGPVADPLERREELLRARAAWAQLPASDRRFLAHCLAEERSPQQLAGDSGVSVRAIYKRKLAIRRKLQALLDAPRTLTEAMMYRQSA